MTEGPLGRFLELALSTRDLQGLYHCLQALGFTQAPTTDARTAGYAVFTDGRITLGLHEAATPTAAALVFVRPELRALATALTVRGIELQSLQLDDGAPHELTLQDPDGQTLCLREARTFSTPHIERAADPGWFTELMLPVTELPVAIAFWEALGFVHLGEERTPWPHAVLTSDTLNLGLYPRQRLDRPGLLFQSESVSDVQRRFEHSGLPTRRFTDSGVELLNAHLPDGTPLWVASDV